MPVELCDIEGCERPRYAHVWCRRHYDNWARWGDPVLTWIMPIAPKGRLAPEPKPPAKWKRRAQPKRPPKIRRTCSVEGCTKVHKARGFCDTHYRRWLAHGDPGPPELHPRKLRTSDECLVEGCDGIVGVPGTARGMCWRHYRRWRVYGDPLGRPG